MTGRTRPLAVLFVLAAGVTPLAILRWPSNTPALDCPPESIHLGPDGVARCGPGGPLSAGQKRTVGQKLNLNEVTADELALLPEISLPLAQAIVEQRTKLGGFHTWPQVDAIEGVGPARLQALQSQCDFGAQDAGLW